MARIITAPPQTITKDDHGGYILIVTALLTTWSILFLIMRGVIRRIGPNHHFASDDAAALTATVLGCVQATLVMIAVNNAGLGNRIGTLNREELHRTAMLDYASNMIWPMAVASSKIAMTELTARLSMHQSHLIACRAISAVSGIWGLASMLAIAIGCQSRRWDLLDRCSNLPLSWIAIGVFDIITEICLFLVPVFMTWPLTMPRRSKFIVLLAFGSRLPLIAVIVLRLVYLYGIRNSHDYTWDLQLPVILSQIELHYGLYAMTLPCLRPLLNALNTGMMAAQVDSRSIGPACSTTMTLQSSVQSWKGKSFEIDPFAAYPIRQDSAKVVDMYDRSPIHPLPPLLVDADLTDLPIVLRLTAAEQQQLEDEIGIAR